MDPYRTSFGRAECYWKVAFWLFLRSRTSLVNIVLSVSTRLKRSLLFCHQETVNKKKRNEREIFVIMLSQVNMKFGQYYLFGCKIKQVSLERQISP